MDFQWLRLQFKLYPSKTKAALARHLGLEPPAISKILSGTRQIKAHEYVKMREFFGLGQGIGYEGEQTSKAQEAYVLKPLQNLSEKSTQAGEWSIPASILGQKTTAKPEQVRIFLINENFMEPDFKKGEHVVVDMSDNNPINKDVYVVSDGHSYMVRYCETIARSSPRKVEISAKSKDFDTHVVKLCDINIIGKVIGKMLWV